MTGSARTWLREAWDDTSDILIAFLIAMTALVVFTVLTTHNSGRPARPAPPTGVEVFDWMDGVNPVNSVPARIAPLDSQRLREQQVS